LSWREQVGGGRLRTSGRWGVSPRTANTERMHSILLGHKEQGAGGVEESCGARLKLRLRWWGLWLERTSGRWGVSPRTVNTERMCSILLGHRK
jgi:hypothetical protein